MSSKVTAVAPSNIAFIKYWGTRDVERTIPYNPSISMTLRSCVSRCTIEHLPESNGIELLWRRNGELALAPESFAAPILRHVERLRGWAEVAGGFRIGVENSFPTAAGIASSASGFAALTIAVASALGRELGAAEASILAQASGSGSAARSVIAGFVEWPGRDGAEAAEQIASPGHWGLSDVIAVVSSEPKEVSSREGHRRAPSSPFFEQRMQALPGRLEQVRAAIRRRDIEQLGQVIEEEALELHLIAMSSHPPIFYWSSGTVSVLRHVRVMRERGLATYATIDAGPNVHVICPSDNEDEVAASLEELEEVELVIRDRVGSGPFFSEDHVY